MNNGLRGLLLAALAAWALGAAGQSGRVGTLRAAELRADKLPDAAVLAPLAAGTPLRVVSVEGNWALVETEGAAPRRGWLRAADLPQANAPAADASGARAPEYAALSLGVRSLPARNSRHALIIGIGRYADAHIAPLPGARVDRESATQMAQAMQVPAANMRYLHDEQATGDAIRRALRDLGERVQEGDRVFIHFSGHGTRFNDVSAGGCVEALLAHDGGASGTITNREMAQLLQPMTRRTDKLFVMYDACHSGGVIARDAQARTRGILLPGDEGRLRPKFSAISDECSKPVNVKTRNLMVEAADKGALPNDIIHVSSSRDNEISFDDELKGGLATQFMRDCMLRDARDHDGSGAISVEEIRACAQEKINQRMRNDADFKPHHLVLSGNAGFVPAWFGNSQLAAPPQALAATSAVPPPLTGAQALRQIFEQRDAKRRVQVTQARERLRIGRDPLDFKVQSDRAGYVYVAMAGSDNRALQLLFPNDLDRDNRIDAGRPLALPRAQWRLRPAGPPGTNELLVIVADGPRDLSALAKEGPFTASLNDAAGRAALGSLLTRSRPAGEDAHCAAAAARQNRPQCSDAFGAVLFKVEEIQ
jgi:hypothetical protein